MKINAKQQFTESHGIVWHIKIEGNVNSALFEKLMELLK
jgi:hypothetical protein